MESSARDSGTDPPTISESNLSVSASMLSGSSGNRSTIGQEGHLELRSKMDGSCDDTNKNNKGDDDDDNGDNDDDNDELVENLRVPAQTATSSSVHSNSPNHSNGRGSKSAIKDVRRRSMNQRKDGTPNSRSMAADPQSGAESESSSESDSDSENGDVVLDELPKRHETAFFYGDSLTWGMAHDYTGRYATPWPRLIESSLVEMGISIADASMCSRTTKWDDEGENEWLTGGEPHDFNGRKHFATEFISANPKYLVLLLGTNDLKFRIRAHAGRRVDANFIARNAAELVLLGQEISEKILGNSRKHLKVIFVAPPTVRLTRLALASGYDEKSVAISRNFADAYGKMASKHGWSFVHLREVNMAASVDGVHITENANIIVAAKVLTAFRRFHGSDSEFDMVDTIRDAVAADRKARPLQPKSRTQSQSQSPFCAPAFAQSGSSRSRRRENNKRSQSAERYDNDGDEEDVEVEEEEEEERSDDGSGSLDSVKGKSDLHVRRAAVHSGSSTKRRRQHPQQQEQKQQHLEQLRRPQEASQNAHGASGEATDDGGDDDHENTNNTEDDGAADSEPESNELRIAAEKRVVRFLQSAKGQLPDQSYKQMLGLFTEVVNDGARMRPGGAVVVPSGQGLTVEQAVKQMKEVLLKEGNRDLLHLFGTLLPDNLRALLVSNAPME